MDVTADLHLHSKYSRACSKSLTIDNLEKYAKMKGLTLLGTGDFQHPKWNAEIKQHLKDHGNGVLMSKTGFPFVLQTELSLIYTQNNKGRRVHVVVLCPNLAIGDQIIDYLSKKGRLDYDGRPIFKIPCDQFTEDMHNISPDIEVIPAHAWTPWFSVFGSKSGFDSLEEAFGDQRKHIHAIETGLSSDPAMNWRLSKLDNVTLISSSDAHSHYPWRIGREATVFSMKDISYKELINAIRKNNVVETLEFYPEEGKYHFDGHRACETFMSPAESKALKQICPKCHTPLTIGVASRVEDLADQKEGRKPANAKPFRSLVPLSEVIAHALHCPVASNKVWAVYTPLVNALGNELAVLKATKEQLLKHTDEKIASAITQTAHLKWRAGYDGEYGVPLFDGEKAKPAKAVVVKSPQRDLSGF